MSRLHPVAEAVLDAYAAPLLDLLNPVEAACETVARLAERFELVVITNGADELQRAKLGRCGLGLLERTAVVSGSFGVGKPHEAIFHHACSVARVAPERALHVGDSPVNDVEGAIRAGMHGVLVRTAIPHPPSDVQPHAVIERLVDLLPLLGLGAATGA